jgi:hypothetical protein
MQAGVGYARKRNGTFSEYGWDPGEVADEG